MVFKCFGLMCSRNISLSDVPCFTFCPFLCVILYLAPMQFSIIFTEANNKKQCFCVKKLYHSDLKSKQKLTDCRDLSGVGKYFSIFHSECFKSQVMFANEN